MGYIGIFILMMIFLSFLRGNRNGGTLLGILIFIIIMIAGGLALQFFLPLLLIFGLIRVLRTLFIGNNKNYYNNYNNRNSNRYNNRTNSNYRSYTFNSYEDFEEFFRNNNFNYNNQYGSKFNNFNNENFEDFFRYQNNQGNYYQQNNYQNYYHKSNDEYLKILGLSSGATKEEIKKAYLKKVSIHHPDRHSNKSEAERKKHEEEMKKINEAYENLTKFN